MTDQYDKQFDMTEYTALRDAFAALPEAQLPAGLHADALFARMDAAAAEPAPAPAKPAKAVDIRCLRRPIAIAAGMVLVVAAYLGLSRTGLLQPKGNFSTTMDSVSSSAASESTASENAAFLMESALDTGSTADADTFGAESTDEPEGVAPNKENGVADSKSCVGLAPDDDSSDDLMLGAEAPGAANGIPDTGAAGETDLPAATNNIPAGFTLLADAAQAPDDVLASTVGVTFDQLQRCLLSAGALSTERTARLNCISSSDSRDGRYALDLRLFEPIYCADCGGDIMTPSGSNLYVLSPAGDGYDIAAGDVVVAHLAKN